MKTLKYLYYSTYTTKEDRGYNTGINVIVDECTGWEFSQNRDEFKVAIYLTPKLGLCRLA